MKLFKLISKELKPMVKRSFTPYFYLLLKNVIITCFALETETLSLFIYEKKLASDFFPKNEF